jgi:hypothetical protein
MKKLMLGLFAISLASPTFADTPVIRAKKVTCQELQDSVRNYGTVTVTTKSFIFTKKLDVSHEIECGANLLKKQAFFDTSDVEDCAAGFYCARRPVVVVDHEPRRERPRHEIPRRSEPHRRVERRPAPPRRVERPSDNRPTRPQRTGPRTERPTRRERVERPHRPGPGPRREGNPRTCRGGACP